MGRGIPSFAASLMQRRVVTSQLSQPREPGAASGRGPGKVWLRIGLFCLSVLLVGSAVMFAFGEHAEHACMEALACAPCCSGDPHA